MASSCSTSLLAPSFPIEIVPYVPRAPKSKPKPKPKPKATTKKAEHSRSGVGSSKDGGEWFHIDDFPMPDSNASLPTLFEAADASGSVDHDVVGGLGAASESEKPEHYQFGRESLDEGGTDHATYVAKTNLATNGLLDGSSRGFPLIVESDTAEEHHSTTHVEPSNGASDYQENLGIGPAPTSHRVKVIDLACLAGEGNGEIGGNGGGGSGDIGCDDDFPPCADIISWDSSITSLEKTQVMKA
jgi:hypothetical protein